MTEQGSVHVTVLKNEVIEWLAHDGEYKNKIFIDGTFGGGGITEDLLNRGARVIAIDQDASAFQRRQDLIQKYPKTLIPIHSNFQNLEDILKQQNITTVHGITLDLGVSSDQLDTPKRGFAYRHTGPLDMRMNPDVQKRTAADILNRAPEEKLADIFYHYGDEKKARVLARNICTTRKTTPFETTDQLLKEVEKIYPVKIGQRRSHPAIRIFQALRIEVNDELNALKKVLIPAAHALAPQARLVIVTFHSLEERLVKSTFKDLCADTLDAFGRVEKHAPFKQPLRKAKPTEAEVSENNRARSATLRILERL